MNRQPSEKTVPPEEVFYEEKFFFTPSISWH
jgi:hypothetical protein